MRPRVRRRRKPRSPFPASFFWDRYLPERVALRESARAITKWRRAAEAGGFYWLEKPRLIAISERFDTIQKPWREMRRRAERALERHPNIDAIHAAYVAEWRIRNTRPLSEVEQLRREVADLRKHVTNLEKATPA